MAPVSRVDQDAEPQTVFQKLARLEVTSDRLYRAVADQADVEGYSRQLELESDLASPLTSSEMERIAQAFRSSLKVMLFDLAPARFWERHLASYYAARLSEAEAGTLVETYEHVALLPLSRLQELRQTFTADRLRDLLSEVRARSYRFKVSSQAMAPALLPGDHVVVNLAAYHTDRPRRGDVVVFRFPDDQGPLLIDRVIAVPGDQVQIRDQRVSVNGEALLEPYVQHTDESILTGTVRDHLGPVTVPPDQYFVMGDNREWSVDSRFLGSISLETIVGKAVFIYWSVDPKTQTPRWEHLNQPLR
jgi:signal peptidase I